MKKYYEIIKESSDNLLEDISFLKNTYDQIKGGQLLPGKLNPNYKRNVAIGAGVIAGGTALAGGALWMLKKRRCKKKCMMIQDPTQQQMCMSKC